jgi:hypothetical protein
MSEAAYISCTYFTHETADERTYPFIGTISEFNTFIQSNWQQISSFNVAQTNVASLNISMRGGSTQISICDESVDSLDQILNMALSYNGWMSLETPANMTR